jgi:hypothetical protein
MLIIDGVKYRLWTPKDEESEFHPMVKAHSKQLFGEDSFYFDVRHIIKSGSGIGSIPDAYVLNFSGSGTWYVVENELASHPVFDHVVKQLGKFINGIENPNSRNQILDLLYEQIDNDPVLEATVRKLIETKDIYHFLSKLLSTEPKIVIIINEKTIEIEEAVRVLKYDTRIIEFKTYVREDSENVRAHLFEPLFSWTRAGSEADQQVGHISHYARRGFTGKLPSAFVFDNKRFAIASWKQLLLTVSSEMASLHMNEFNKVLSLKGRKRPYFTENASKLRAPEEIRDTGIFVETNLSSNAIVRLSHNILRLFGHDEILKIESN